MQTSCDNRTGTWSLTGQVVPGTPGQVVVVRSLPFRIGRHADNDLSLAMPGVSGNHAVIDRGAEGLELTDAGSRNGVFVNGVRVEGAVPLAEGDVVHFANAAFRVGCEMAVTGGSPSATCSEELADEALALVQFDRLMDQRAVVPHLQPIVQMSDRRWVGFEILARSRLVGLQSAAQLFEAAAFFAQESRLSELIRESALEVCQDGWANLYMNTHPSELDDDRLLESLAKLRRVFPTQELTLEIHEACVTDPARMRALRGQVSQLGIQLAYDDFGAGQSRLVELMEVPPDVLKFDMALIRNVDTATPQRRKMLESLVKTVSEAGIVTLAEGIETELEAEVCLEIGFALGQGYLFGKPGTIDSWRDTQPLNP